uniref:DSBA-like thioredoxin domain-containing protein n=1 Tax=Brassica oleracea TaxID=3712 RepID=A0A3P6A9L3_BRAOL|nr:unnamed protein product [Brassica oleracea]
MVESASNTASKKLIQIDVSSDSVCPWCFVGKMNLDKAIDASKDQYNFEIRWRPFFLDSSAPKGGVSVKLMSMIHGSSLQVVPEACNSSALQIAESVTRDYRHHSYVASNGPLWLMRSLSTEAAESA